jgi:ABC-type phosphate/phosphonate transport system substrate-binding protein
VAVSKRYDADFRYRVQAVLTDLHEVKGLREILDHGFVDHFTAVGAGDYDDIRAMLETCERAGFMEIR